MAEITPTWEARLDWVTDLNDGELTSQVERLNQRRQGVDAELLLHLSELDRRGLYRDQACSSLFTYCTERLGFSEDAAYKRVGAARMLRQFPMIYGLLVEGRIHLSALLVLRAHVSDANHSKLLTSACGKSKRQVEQLVAAAAPRPDEPTHIRKLPDRRPVSSAAVADTTSLAFASTPNCSPVNSASSDRSPKPKLTAPSSSNVQPLSQSSYRVVFTASNVLKEKLDRARELSSHATSPSDLPALLERALDLLIEHEEKRRCALGATRGTKTNRRTSAPRRVAPGANSKPSRYVPAEVRRVLWERDQGQCTFVDSAGRRCSERHFLEIEHRRPHALGGPSSLENCVLLCRSHNALRAEEVFGSSTITAKIAAKIAAKNSDTGR